MKYKLVTAPTSEPVTVADQLLHARIDAPEAADELEAMITESREEFEARTGQQLLTATYDQFYDGFCRCLELAKQPVQSITSVKYIDDAGVTQTVNPSSYVLDAAGAVARVVFLPDYNWPATRRQPNSVTVRFVAGYGTAAEVPARAKQWIKIRTTLAYDDRNMTQEPAGLERIIKAFKGKFVS